MKKSIIYSFIVIFVTLIINCCSKKNNEKIIKIQEQVEQIKKSKVIFPDSLKIHYPDNDTINSEHIVIDKNYKVVTFIDGECGSCINQLNEWNKSIRWLLKFSEVKFVPILYTSDLEIFKSKMLPNIHLDNPIYIDLKNMFYTINELHQYDNSLQSFLLDSNNRVILVGNPTYSEKLMKLYKEEFNKRLD